MRRAIALLILGACGGDSGGPTGPITARIAHYDYTFDIDSRASHAVLTAEVEVAGDCLTLPFRAQNLAADSLRINGEPMTSAMVAGGAITMCGSGYEAGETLAIETDQTIALETLETSQVGYSVSTDFQGNQFYYLVSWVNGCDQFAPCDNRPSVFASYTFHVTHAAGLVARCPGTITEVSATETQCDFTREGPTYSTFGVAVSSAWPSVVDKGMWGSAKVTFYDAQQAGITNRIDPTYNAGFVAFMESTFGPYPYGDELRVLIAPTYWGGFEHPGNIVLDNSFGTGGQIDYFDPLRHTLDHEITHMWAGDQVTIADTYDFFWKESMAEYLPYVYEDTVDATQAAKTPNYWKAGAVGSRFFLVPGEKPALFDYYGDVYMPGPMIMYRQLEALSSRDQVIAGIKAAIGTPGALSVDQLIAALETSTGLDLQDYAAAWIRGTGAPEWPEVTLTFTPAAGTSTLHVLQTQALERRCKFHVALRGANPDENVEVAVDTFHDGTDQTLNVTTPAFTVTQTVLDPHNECLVYATGATANKPRLAHPWAPGRDAPLVIR